MEHQSNPNVPEMGRGDYVSVAEAAKILGVSRAALYVAVRSREIPSAKVGGTIKLSRAVLEAFLLAQTLECA